MTFAFNLFETASDHRGLARMRAIDVLLLGVLPLPELEHGPELRDGRPELLADAAAEEVVHEHQQPAGRALSVEENEDTDLAGVLLEV